MNRQARSWCLDIDVNAKCAQNYVHRHSTCDRLTGNSNTPTFYSRLHTRQGKYRLARHRHWSDAVQYLTLLAKVTA